MSKIFWLLTKTGKRGGVTRSFLPLAMIVMLTAICFSVVLAEPQLAQPINIQGRLTDRVGNPVKTAVTIEVRFYDAATGGNLLYAETHSLITPNGFYSLPVGSGTPLSTGTESSAEAAIRKHLGIYFTIKVNSDTEMLPRTQLFANAYSLNAYSLQGSRYLKAANVGTDAAAAPSDATGVTPRIGDLWYDTLTGTLRIYNGENWGNSGTGAISTDSIISGTLGTSRGGTGLSEYSAGSLLMGGSDGGLTTLSAGEVGSVLKATESGLAWVIPEALDDLDAAIITRGVLPVRRGGTGLSSIGNGQLLVGNSAGEFSALTPGLTGQVLQSNGSSLEWTTPPVVEGRFLSLTGGTMQGPIAFAAGQTLGASGISGVLMPAQGGTGQGSIGAGELLVGDGSGGFTRLGPGTQGQLLSSTGSGVGWTQPPMTGEGVFLPLTGGTMQGPVTFSEGQTFEAARLNGVLSVAQGGTGMSQITSNALLMGNADGGLTPLVPTNDGSVLSSTPNGLAWVTLSGGGNFLSDGSIPMSGPLVAFPGSVTATGIGFLNDADTGFFQSAHDQLSLATGGVERVMIDAAGNMSLRGHALTGISTLGVSGVISANSVTATTFIGDGAGLTGINAATLGGLSAGNFVSVNTASHVNGEALVWNGTTWTIARVQPQHLDSAGASQGQVMRWNGTSWVPSSFGLSDLVSSGAAGEVLRSNGSSWLASRLMPSDLGTGSAVSNDVLLFDGTTWINGRVSLANVTGTLAPGSLSAGGASTGQVLRFDGSAWTPGSLSFSSITGTLSPGSLDAAGVSTGSLLRFNGTSWTPATLGMTDIIAPGAVGQVLRSSGSNWVSSQLSPSDLAAGGAVMNSILRFDGSAWTPGNLDFAGISGTLNPGVIAQAGASTGQVLRYSGSAWSAGALQPGDLASAGASTGQFMRWSGSSWTPSGLALSDLVTPGLAGQVLRSNGSAWTTATIGLPDIIAPGAAGQVLRSSGSNWVSSQLSPGDLATGGAVANNILRFDGTAWTPGNLTYSSLGGTLSPSALDTTGAVTGNVLRYGGSSWVASMLQPQDIASGGASTGQVMKWNGTGWGPGASTSATTITPISSNYTASATDNVIVADTSTAGFTLTLPDASASQGKQYVIKAIGSRTLIIRDAAGHSLDNDSRAMLTNALMTVASDGTKWVIVSVARKAGPWEFTSPAEEIDSGIGGSESSMAVDASSAVHVAYGDVPNADLKYATNASGTWVTQTVDSSGNVGSFPSLALDGAGKVHILYRNADVSGLKYATNIGGSWTIQAIDTTGSVAGRSSLALDANGKAHISYYHSTNQALAYTTNASGTWSSVLVDDTAGNVGLVNKIGLDVSGKVHLVYSDSASGAMKYATNVSGAWVFQVIDTGNSIGIAIDAGGKIHIAYGGDGAYAYLKYASNASGSWTTQSLGLPAIEYTAASFQLDAYGKAHLVHSPYQNGSTMGTKYTTNAGGTWVQHTFVDGTTNTLPALALDAHGIAHIIYTYAGVKKYITMR